MNKTLNSLIGLLVLLAIVLFGNIAANKISLRLDLTENKLYTLNEGTINILENLEDNVTFKFYFSKSLEGVNHGEKLYAEKVLNLLREYQRQSDNVTLEIIDPIPGEEEEALALRYELAPQKTRYQENAFFGLVVSNFSGEEVIKRFDPRAEKFLEYEITRAVYLLNLTDKKPKIGILSSYPVLGQQPPRGQFGAPQQPAVPPWLIMHEVVQIYDVQPIQPTAEKIADDINLLVVIHPQNLSEKMEYAIDQYVMSGRNAIFYVDPQTIRDMSQQNQFRPPAQNTSLLKVFTKWGIEIDYNKISLDKKLAGFVGQGVRHPAFIDLKKENLHKEDVITSQLANLLLVFPGTVKKKDGFDKISFEPLIQTSEAVDVKDKFVVRNTRDFQELMSSVESRDKSETLAGIFSGQFSSAFDKAPEGVSGQHKIETPKEGAFVMVVADADMLEDQYWVQRTPFGMMPYRQNGAFFNNSIEKMLGNKDLISLRSRGEFRRPFDYVDDLELKAQDKYREQQEGLKKEQEEIEKKLKELLSKSGADQRVIVSEDVSKEIAEFQLKQVENTKARNKLVKELHKDIEDLGFRIKIVNIGGVPLIIIVLGIIVYFSRNSRVGK